MTSTSSPTEPPNAAVIRRAYRAFAEGDNETARSCFTDDAVWRVPGRNPSAGDYHGLDGIQRFFTTIREISGGTFSVEPIDLLIGEQRCISLQRATGRHGDKTLDTTACLVMDLRDGKIAAVQAYYCDQYALDEFWS